MSGTPISELDGRWARVADALAVDNGWKPQHPERLRAAARAAGVPEDTALVDPAWAIVAIAGDRLRTALIPPGTDSALYAAAELCAAIIDGTVDIADRAAVRDWFQRSVTLPFPPSLAELGSTGRVDDAMFDAAAAYPCKVAEGFATPGSALEAALERLRGGTGAGDASEVAETEIVTLLQQVLRPLDRP